MRLRRGFALAAAAMLAVVSLPGSTTGLGEAVAKVATPGSSDYRHFSSLDKAARRFGASDAQINTVAKSVKTLGLQFAADPTRLFERVSGSTQQWQTALGTPLSKQAATASSPFITYTLPAQTPAALQPSGTSLLLPQTLVYDPTAEGNRPPNGMRPTPSPGAASTATPTKAARPFPFNTGTPLAANCSSPLLAQRRVYAQQQVQTAYGIDTLRAHAAGTPVITVLDLGGGWLANDLKLAGQCFGYAPPDITQTQGDGIAAPIGNAVDETSLDLQTAAAVAPRAQLRLVQSTLNGVLDGFSRALGDPGGVPDVISVSFGGCAIAENQGLPAYTATINAVLAMTALVLGDRAAAEGHRDDVGDATRIAQRPAEPVKDAVEGALHQPQLCPGGHRRGGLQIQGGLVDGIADGGGDAVALGLGDVGWGVSEALPRQLEVVGQPATPQVQDRDHRRAGGVGSQRVDAVGGLHLLLGVDAALRQQRRRAVGGQWGAGVERKRACRLGRGRGAGGSRAH